ncbi:PadR family transcriptional regulator [Afifella sp. IM 167]|uniref:PadR family transcriptional regulator n=1 Tax=Afifella sp. IM 167 TaxID=2033586 RepID=UPI001CCD01E8|nr:PadR family transcriptional regulator [Afifella sp. IM 167]MBZ8134217.1 PadR family transcriptional regulator [Afifella sp. IM 167]
MNVTTLCLAILFQEEATGYEIKKMSTDGKYSYFVDASFGSIYPALARLERDGFVTCREESQPGKPARKIYSITEAGRARFAANLLEEPEPDIFRSAFLLVTMYAPMLPRHVVSRAIDIRVNQLTQEIEKLTQLAAEEQTPGAHWAIDYGLCCFRQSIEYLNDNRERLEAIAGTANDSPLPAAAE